MNLMKLSESRLLRYIGLMAVMTMSGCMVAKPFGYVQVWTDRNTYGAPSFFIERVRTDAPPRVSAATWIVPDRAATSTEQSKSEKPEVIADAQVPEGVWIFQ